jgi:hypothetical protein
LGKGEVMQYILTQEEKDNLVPKSEVEKRDEALELARRIIVNLAGIQCGGYCNFCPVSSIQLDPKSKDLVPSDELSELMCRQYKRYGK